MEFDRYMNTSDIQLQPQFNSSLEIQVDSIMIELFDNMINIKFDESQKIINDGFDTNERDKSGNTILHKLIDDEESIESVMLAVELGFDVNALNAKGYSALYLIRKYMKPDRYNKMIHDYLIDNGAVSKPDMLDNQWVS